MGKRMQNEGAEKKMEKRKRIKEKSALYVFYRVINTLRPANAASSIARE